MDSGMSARPIGTLSQKIQCQLMPVDDGTADDRSGRHRQPGDAAPQSDRGTALLGRERLADQGQRHRHDRGSRRALNHAGRDERAHAR